MATEDSATAYGIRNNESGTSENLNFHSSGFDIKRKDIHDTIILVDNIENILSVKKRLSDTYAQ